MTYDPKREIDLQVSRRTTGFGGFFKNEKAAVTSDFVGVLTAGVVLSVALTSTVTGLVADRDAYFTSYVSDIRRDDDTSSTIVEETVEEVAATNGNGNNGHGNDADGNDDSNPGASNDEDDYTDDDGSPGNSA